MVINGTTDDPDRKGTTMGQASFAIDCDDCTMQHTDACKDCVVSFLLDREPDDAVLIDAAEARAIKMLERAGLVPALRFERAG